MDTFVRGEDGVSAKSEESFGGRIPELPPQSGLGLQRHVLFTCMYVAAHIDLRRKYIAGTCTCMKLHMASISIT